MTEQRMTAERRSQIEANDAGFETGAWRFPAACIGMANQRRELLAELRAVEAERDAYRRSEKQARNDLYVADRNIDALHKQTDVLRAEEARLRAALAHIAADDAWEPEGQICLYCETRDNNEHGWSCPPTYARAALGGEHAE